MHMKNTVVATVIAACSLALIAGCGKKKADAESGGKIKIAVRTMTVTRTTLNRKQVFTGVLEPLKKTDIAPMTPGRIRRINVEIGDRVARGAVLAVMDDAALAATAAQFQPVKAQYDRAQRLYADKAMPKVQYEQVEAQYIALKRQLDQIEENTTIRAPFAGVITDKTAEEGEIYAPRPLPGRSAGLLQLTQLDPLKIDLNVDAETVSHIVKGMAVEMTVDALPDTVFTGTVDFINPSANPLSHTFLVRIAVPNRAGRLKAGYFLKTAVITGSKQNVVAVPQDAIVGDRVFVVHDSIAVARPVTAGWRTGEFVEITAGLAEQERIVVEGNKALPDSSLITIRQ